jgi:hypothetical protein
MKSLKPRRRRLIVVAALLALFLVTFAGSCDGDKEPETQRVEREQTDRVLKGLRSSVPFPKLTDSLELRNLARRYERLSDAKKIGYVYLISYGRIIANYTVRGKVSSLESQFTNPKQLSCRKIEVPNFDDQAACGEIEQAEPDGSYGDNPEGIFFFTVEGEYKEWAGDYLYSDQRMTLRQPPELVVQAEANGG